MFPQCKALNLSSTEITLNLKFKINKGRKENYVLSNCSNSSMHGVICKSCAHFHMGITSSFVFMSFNFDYDPIYGSLCTSF